MKVPAGWQPDPHPPAPGQPPLLRYWDGERWTKETSPVQAVHTAAYASAYPAGAVARTPDGVPLAGWWRRVGAYLIDAVLQAPVVLVLCLPWLAELLDDEPDPLGTALLGGLIGAVVSCAYNVTFLAWRQATPGKLALGLRVRLRVRPGPLPLGTILARWAAQYGVGVVTLVSYVGTLVSLFALLDGLWPLWDHKKQAIHDKLARTNVVRVR